MVFHVIAGVVLVHGPFVDRPVRIPPVDVGLCVLTFYGTTRAPP